MGFKMRSFYVLCGSDEFPSTGGTANHRLRSEILLTKCAQCLIDCECGWQLDTSKSVTTSNYSEIPTVGDSPSYMPGLFFINVISGCKLFMAYFGGSAYAGGIRNSNSHNMKFDASIYRSTGLCMSMIPAGSASVFGDPSLANYSTFIPSDATILTGTLRCNSSSTGSANTAFKATSGVYYKYYIFATPYVVMVGVNFSADGIPGRPFMPNYATGRIFGTLAHASDNAINSQYGTICFKEIPNSSAATAEAMGNLVNYQNPRYYSSGSSQYYTPGYGSSVQGKPSLVAFTDPSGNWINNHLSTTPYFNTVFATAQPYLLGGGVVNMSGSIRWSPIAVLAISNDIATYGVVPGDGLKGYLDTDLFRAVSGGLHGDYYNNSSFYCTDDAQGFVIGWDPSNNS